MMPLLSPLVPRRRGARGAAPGRKPKEHRPGTATPRPVHCAGRPQCLEAAVARVR
jgi:hypothetical protein